MNIPEKPFFTPSELIQILGVDPSHIHNLISNGQLPVVKIGKLYLIERSLVVELLTPSTVIPAAAVLLPKPKINPETWMMSVVDYYKKLGANRAFFTKGTVFKLMKKGLVSQTNQGILKGVSGTAYSAFLAIRDFFGRETVRELGGAKLTKIKINCATIYLQTIYLIEFVREKGTPIPDPVVTGPSPAVGGVRQDQARPIDPALDWFRKVVLAIDEKGSLNKAFTASDIFNLCKKNDLNIHSLCSLTEFVGRQMVGRLLKKVFKGKWTLGIEGFIVERNIADAEYPYTAMYYVVKRVALHPLPLPPKESI